MSPTVLLVCEKKVIILLNNKHLTCEQNTVIFFFYKVDNDFLTRAKCMNIFSRTTMTSLVFTNMYKVFFIITTTSYLWLKSTMKEIKK